MIVIEHHQAVMAHADWIIDLGPGAGHDGGRVVFEGTPADLVAGRYDPHRRAPRGVRRHLTGRGQATRGRRCTRNDSASTSRPTKDSATPTRAGER